VLFWDEPETNLNPKLMKAIVGILIELHRLGVQIVLSTHDYVILKEFDLQTKETDKIQFHSLYRSKTTGEIEIASTGKYLEISPNAIDDTFGSFVEREIERSMKGLGR
jgi:energy-coupling factor transporter ATP-binding protein EcfA2